MNGGVSHTNHDHGGGAGPLGVCDAMGVEGLYTYLVGWRGVCGARGGSECIYVVGLRGGAPK